MSLRHPENITCIPYPFGSSLNTRSFSAGSGFRFGFNGKEKENNFIANEYTFEFRIYNSGLGRFLSMDPDLKKHPWQSPYAYFCNSPVYIIDFLGLGDQPNWYTNIENSKNKREIKKFRRILSKEDKVRMDQITQMSRCVEKTKAVDEFAAYLNEAYKDKRGLYRIYKSTQSTGHNVIFSMAMIWAYKVDPKRQTQISQNDNTDSKPLDWEVISDSKGAEFTYKNNSGSDGFVQVRFFNSPEYKFQPQKFSLNLKLPEQGEFSTVIENTNVLEPMNSEVIKVPKNAQIQLITTLPQNIIGITYYGIYDVSKAIEKGEINTKSTNRYIGEGLLTPQTINQYIKSLDN